MAETIRLQLIVDSSAGTRSLTQLEAQLKKLQGRVAELSKTGAGVGPIPPIGTPAANSIAALTKQLAELRKQLAASSVGSKEFEQAAAAVRDTEAALKAASQAAKGVDAKPAAGSVAELRASVKAMTAELETVKIGSARFEELKGSIFKANSEIRDLKQDIRGVTPEKLVASFAAFGKAAAGSFAAASSAMSLYKGETASAEEVQRAAAKAQEYLTLVTSIGSVITDIDATKEARLTIAQNARAVATRGVALAQSALNAVMSANPLALAVLAATALVGILIALKDKVEFIGKAFSFLGNIVSGVFAFLSDSENYRSKKRLDNLKAEADATEKRYDREMALAQAAGIDTAVIEKEKAEAHARSIAAQIEELERRRERQKELNAEDQKEFDALQQEKLDAESEAAAKSIAIQTKASEDQRTADAAAAAARIAGMKDGFAKEKAEADAARDERIAQLNAELAVKAAAQKKYDDDVLSRQRDIVLARAAGTSESNLAGFQKELENAQARRTAFAAQQKGSIDILNAQIEEAANTHAQKVQKIDVDAARQTLQAVNELAVLKTEEGTQARLDAEVRGIASVRDFDLKQAGLTAVQVETIKLKSAKEIADKIRAFQQANDKEEAARQINQTREGSAERMAAEISAAQTERQLAIDSSRGTADELLNIEAEYEEKVLAAKLKFSKARLDDASAIITQERGTQELVLRARLTGIEQQLQTVRRGSAEEIALIRQRADIEQEIERNNSERLVALRRLVYEKTKNDAADNKKREIDTLDAQLKAGLVSKEKYDSDLAEINSRYNAQAIRDEKAFTAEIENINAESNKAVSDGYVRTREQIADWQIAQLEKIKGYLDVAGSFVQGMVEMSTNAIDAIEAKDNARLKQLEKNNDKEKADLKKKLDAGLISQTAYTNAVAKLDENLANARTASEEKVAAKRKELAKKAAAAEFAITVAKTVANTAEAIMKAFTLVPPASYVAAGIAAATGALQIAVANSEYQKVQALADGGIVTGPGGPREDRVPARLSPGESVINARSTAMFAPLLSAINVAGGGRAFSQGPATLALADGGVVPRALDRTDDLLDELRAIRAAQEAMPERTQVFVSEADITRAQRRVSVIESRGRIN